MTYTSCALLLLNQEDCKSLYHHYREGSVELVCQQKIACGYDPVLHHKNHVVTSYYVRHDLAEPRSGTSDKAVTLIVVSCKRLTITVLMMYYDIHVGEKLMPDTH